MNQVEFKTKLADRYCRKCINKELGINLQKEDCCYMMYPNQCQGCKQVGNIVDQLHWRARCKLLFAKSKNIVM